MAGRRSCGHQRTRRPIGPVALWGSGRRPCTLFLLTLGDATAGSILCSCATRGRVSRENGTIQASGFRVWPRPAASNTAPPSPFRHRPAIATVSIHNHRGHEPARCPQAPGVADPLSRPRLVAHHNDHSAEGADSPAGGRRRGVRMPEHTDSAALGRRISAGQFFLWIMILPPASVVPSLFPPPPSVESI